jgi:hypothetical protein
MLAIINKAKIFLPIVSNLNFLVSAEQVNIINVNVGTAATNGAYRKTFGVGFARAMMNIKIRASE